MHLKYFRPREFESGSHVESLMCKKFLPTLKLPCKHSQWNITLNCESSVSPRIPTIEAVEGGGSTMRT